MALFGVQLDETTISRLTAGQPVLPMGALLGAPGLEPGRPARFLDRSSQVVGSGVCDPENEVFRVWQAELGRGFDGPFFAGRLARALEVRRRMGFVDRRSAYRLVNAEGDHLSGLTFDVYGAYGVVCALSRGLLPYGRALAQAAVEARFGLEGVVVKVRGKGGADKADKVKDEVVGASPPEKLVVHELDVPYEVHLKGALNVGLFTDMREHRRGLARFVAGRRVLNTFAYTGALSVAAARAGASAVTSVDLSGGVLAWAKDNFRLSGIDPEEARFRFETSDVRRYLEKAVAAGERYDVIILDPPTVSAARASSWSMKKDYPDLIALAIRLLPETGGHLWISSNAHGGPGVGKHVAEGLKRAGRTGSVLEHGGLPPDYPTLVTYPEGRYLEVCQLWVDAAT